MKCKYPAQSRLIDFIYEKHGGLIKAAKVMKVSKQLASIWRDQGFIPLKRVAEISKRLNVPNLALNYHQCSMLNQPSESFDYVKKWTYDCLKGL